MPNGERVMGGSGGRPSRDSEKPRVWRGFVGQGRQDSNLQPPVPTRSIKRPSANLSAAAHGPKSQPDRSGSCSASS
jgi:hypothetical protein